MTFLGSVSERFGRTTMIVVVALFGTLIRLYDLGVRVFHYDEAWVGYWVLKSAETGVWHYRPIVHGPFFARVNPVVFDAVGASDISARLMVALVGGALPLAALLFRKRLRDSSTFALALLLAINPILLYYSRFMRFDLLLAAFGLVTLGFVVRTLDTGRPRYVYAAALTFALAFTTKESVLLYLLSWFGAVVLLLDYRLLRARDVDSDWQGVLRASLTAALSGVRRWAVHLVAAGALWLAVVVYFYAPRSPDPSTVSLEGALANPGLWPDVIGEATLGSFSRAIGRWGGGMQGHPYLPYLTDTLATLAEGATLVVALSVVGFLYDRYTAESPSDLVAFTFYVGVANTLGFPLANFLPVPWSTIHAIVPLAIPAAVGLGAIYRFSRNSIVGLDQNTQIRTGGLVLVIVGIVGSTVLFTFLTRITLLVGLFVLLMGFVILVPEVQDGDLLDRRDRRAITTAVVVSLVLTAGLHVAAVAVQTSYLAPTDGDSSPDGGSQLIYQSQAPNALRPTLSTIERVSDGEGTDVLFVGSDLAMDEEAAQSPPPPGGWYARLPLPWYTEQYGTATESVLNVSDAPTDAPVLITGPDHCQPLANRLDDYLGVRVPLDQMNAREICVFIASEHVRSPDDHFTGRATPVETDASEAITDGT